MPRNGSGTYSLPEPPFVAGTVISSASVNDDLSDIASALTGSLPRSGEAGMLGQFKGTDGNVLLPSMSFSNDLNTGFYRVGDDQIGVACGGVQVALFTSDGFQGGLPIGCVLDYAGGTVPALFLLCYGQNVSRTTYATLFAKIGTTYGSGDGVTTFGLPDLRGRLLFGRDDMGGVAAARLTTAFYGADPAVLGNGGGAQSRTLITANLPAYTPSGSVGITDPGHVHSVGGGSIIGTGSNGVQSGGSFTGATSTATLSIVSNTTGITASFTGSAQGGASTAFSDINPALIMNKIIYAGA
jgi:microcystin-dependent protein